MPCARSHSSAAAQQGGEDRRIVDRLEHAEVAGRVVVALDAQVIDLGTDAPDRAVAPVGHPELHCGVLEERAAGENWWRCSLSSGGTQAGSSA